MSSRSELVAAAQPDPHFGSSVSTSLRTGRGQVQSTSTTPAPAVNRATGARRRSGQRGGPNGRRGGYAMHLALVRSDGQVAPRPRSSDQTEPAQARQHRPARITISMA